MPNFTLEDTYNGSVCGIDEAGRGPLAGPVAAGCVYIPPLVRSLPFIADIRDSKKLSASRRESLFEQIMEHCVCGIALINPPEIEELNILRATYKAMSEAFHVMMSSRAQPRDLKISNKEIPPCATLSRNDMHCLIDGKQIPPDIPCPASYVIKGDDKSVSIAAASILAKVSRDRVMRELAAQHPEYGWERNAAYGTKQHIEAINAHGITPHHRRSFAPIRNYLQFGNTKAA